MGRNRFIDHRRPPKSAGIPMVMRNGNRVPANPEPEIETDEVVQLRREVTRQRGKTEELERKLRVKTAEVTGLKQALQDARDETTHLRYQQQQPELEGTMPNRIEIVTVDDIKRNDDTATLKVLADIDSTVGGTHVVIPISQLKAIIKRKQQQHEQRSEQPTSHTGLSEVRQQNQTSNLPNGIDRDTEA